MSGGFRCRWLARLTNGRLGLGRWTQAEVDAIEEWAEMEARHFQQFVDDGDE